MGMQWHANQLYRWLPSLASYQNLCPNWYDSKQLKWPQVQLELLVRHSFNIRKYSPRQHLQKGIQIKEVEFQITFVQFWGSPFKRDIVKWGHIKISVRKHEDSVIGGMTEDLSIWRLTRGQDRLVLESEGWQGKMIQFKHLSGVQIYLLHISARLSTNLCLNISNDRKLTTQNSRTWKSPLNSPSRRV